MTSANSMVARLNSVKRMNCGYSFEEIMKIEELALLDEILESLRKIAGQLAHMDTVI